MKEYGIDKNLEINYSFIGLGSNIKSRKENLTNAYSYIKKHIGNIINFSKIYETEPWGEKNQKKFLNQVVEVKTKHTPLKLLKKCKKIEIILGRVSSKKWGKRLIDLDILYFNNNIISTNKLIIPHQYIHKRKFVLTPLNDIDKDYLHPKLKLSNNALLKKCNDKNSVIEYGI